VLTGTDVLCYCCPMSSRIESAELSIHLDRLIKIHTVLAEHINSARKMSRIQRDLIRFRLVVCCSEENEQNPARFEAKRQHSIAASVQRGAESRWRHTWPQPMRQHVVVLSGSLTDEAAATDLRAVHVKPDLSKGGLPGFPVFAGQFCPCPRGSW
jgi:hypothetical protein